MFSGGLQGTRAEMSLPGPRLEVIRNALTEDLVGSPTRVGLDTLVDAFIAFTEEIRHQKGEHVTKYVAKCGSLDGSTTRKDCLERIRIFLQTPQMATRRNT